ncbi:hypothetical protein BOTBODRAFT_177241 [Botryobasidium botryosum FD-172 SS1]|uniref:Uncharacterized protein n=1 Tax=Botryobasidium botryosum (strain FD-172 SS1) TaxID=930990 RepID=A0A067MAA6_BOTB1|nr:hypothetical protein BOTBODRAFT_177241 [Botryobasidium botryosum FD-172 SS1]
MSSQSQPTAAPQSTPAPQSGSVDAVSSHLDAVPSHAVPDLWLDYFEKFRWDSQAIVGPKGIDNFKFVPDGKTGNWIDPRHPENHVVVRVFGEVASDSQLGPYGNMHKLNADALVFDVLTKSKFRISLGPLSRARAPTLAQVLWKQQGQNLADLQADHKGQPHTATCLAGAKAFKKSYLVNGFLRTTKPGPKTTLNLTTRRIWDTTKEKERDELPLDLFQDNPHPVNATSDDASSWWDEPTQDLSMASWDDPYGCGLRQFPQASTTYLSKLDVRDTQHNPIHPRDFLEALKPGTWLMADCRLVFWDMSEVKKGTPNKTYQLLVESLQVIREAPEPITNQASQLATPQHTPSPSPLNSPARLVGTSSPISSITPTSSPNKRKARSLFPSTSPTHPHPLFGLPSHLHFLATRLTIPRRLSPPSPSSNPPTAAPFSRLSHAASHAFSPALPLSATSRSSYAEWPPCGLPPPHSSSFSRPPLRSPSPPSVILGRSSSPSSRAVSLPHNRALFPLPRPSFSAPLTHSVAIPSRVPQPPRASRCHPLVHPVAAPSHVPWPSSRASCGRLARPMATPSRIPSSSPHASPSPLAISSRPLLAVSLALALGSPPHDHPHSHPHLSVIAVILASGPWIPDPRWGATSLTVVTLAIPNSHPHEPSRSLHITGLRGPCL